MMDDFERYNAAAIDRQMDLVSGLSLSLSRYYGFEREFMSYAMSADSKRQEREYKSAFCAKSAARRDMVRGLKPPAWERVLENSSGDGELEEHPHARIFNMMAADRGLSVRIYDTGPKDYCIAKIKACKFHEGDVSRLDDINRVMVETNDPATDGAVCDILSQLNRSCAVRHREKREMQGFVSDVWQRVYEDGAVAEISFVPAGLVTSSKITHNALRFRRASTGLKNDADIQELYKSACQCIKEKFNDAGKELQVEKKYIEALDMKVFDSKVAGQNLKALEEACLTAVLSRHLNKKWKRFL